MQIAERIKRGFERNKERIYKLAHIAAGYLTAKAVRIHPVVSVLGLGIFLLYELDEELAEGDHAFEELREFGVGYFLGVAEDLGLITLNDAKALLQYI